MSWAVVHAAALGLDWAPTTQMVDLVAWNGPGKSGVVFSVETASFRVVLLDHQGATQEILEVLLTDRDRIYTTVEQGVDYLLTLHV
jgi:hypothetical protein